MLISSTDAATLVTSSLASGFPGAIAIVAVVCFAAWRLHALSGSGAMAALAIGTASITSGAAWAVLVVFFFVTSSTLSRLPVPGTARDAVAYADKGARRDAAQVLANGGLFAVAAVGSALWGSPVWSALGVGSIAVATADTWSTEVGTRWGGTPWDVFRWTRVPPGASGGITLAGSMAAAVGTLVTWTVAQAMQFDTPAFAVVGGGLVGAFSDSVLGATVQERRRCDRCGTATERRVHSCGAATRVVGGVPHFGNDAVNLTSILIGACLTCLLS